MRYLCVVGFATLLGQAILLRELNVAFYGVELVYLLALGVWLLWSALGAAAAGRQRPPTVGQLRFLLVLFALLLIADTVFIRGIRVIFSDVPGAYLPFEMQLLSMALALLAPALLSGLLFQRAAALYVAGGRSLASAYSIESVGALAGGLVATVALALGVQNFTAALICAVVGLATAALPQQRGRLGVAVTVISGMVTLLLLLPFSDPLDRLMTSWTHPNLAASRDTPYGRLTLTRSGEQISLFENDALSFESESTAAEEFVHLPALQRPAPRRMLLLGGFAEGIIPETLQHHPELVDCVELSSTMVDLVRPYLTGATSSYLGDPRVRLILADPRQFLRRSPTYDLILVAMPEPGSGQANRFYTVEFFRQCATRLTPEGVLAFRVTAAENLWTPQLRWRNASIYRALEECFAEVVVLPGGSNLFMASQERLTHDPRLLGTRFLERGIRARLVSAPYIRYVYTNDRFAQVRRALETSESPSNSDRRPVCYQLTVLLWLSRFFPRLAQLEPDAFLLPGSLGSVALGVTAVVILFFFSLARLSPLIRRCLLAAAAGFIGMVLETILVLNYQVRSGVLYQDIGLLLTCFMGGLALGAAAVDRLWRRSGGAAWLRLCGLALPVLFAALSLLVAGGVNSGVLAGKLATGLLLFSSGALVAGLFSYAGFEGVRDQEAVIAPLYAADLAGGCIGAWTASLLVIPLAGMSWAAIYMSPLSLLLLLLVAGRTR